jgi:hypothetical protein
VVVQLKKENYYLKESPNTYTSRCSTTDFFNYEPAVVRSFFDLPDSIAKKVN